jgi:hypothetical protein
MKNCPTYQCQFVLKGLATIDVREASNRAPGSTPSTLVKRTARQVQEAADCELQRSVVATAAHSGDGHKWLATVCPHASQAW